jgi:nucleoid DNA-binding protein
MTVQIDGQEISAGLLVETMMNKPAASARQIVITSADTRALVNESLSDMQTSLPDLPLACQELARVFQSETPDAGYEPFQQLASLWSTIKERELMVANALEISLEELQIDGLSVKQFHDELNAFLREATEALKKRDSILLADLLEYELAPRAEKESAIVAILQEKAEQLAG